MATIATKQLSIFTSRLNAYFTGWSSSDMLQIPSLNHAAIIAQYVYTSYATSFNIALTVALYDFFQTKVPDPLRSHGSQKDIAEFYSCAQSTASTHYRKLLEDRVLDYRSEHCTAEPADSSDSDESSHFLAAKS